MLGDLGEHFDCIAPDLLLVLVDDWFQALDTGEGVDEWCRYVIAQDPRWTIEAVPTLRAWTKPAHVIWAADDRFLPPSWAARLAAEISGVEENPTLLPHAGHFFQPEVPRTAAALLRFLRRADGARAGGDAGDRQGGPA